MFFFLIKHSLSASEISYTKPDESVQFKKLFLKRKQKNLITYLILVYCIISNYVKMI